MSGINIFEPRALGNRRLMMILTMRDNRECLVFRVPIRTLAGGVLMGTFGSLFDWSLQHRDWRGVEW